MTDNSAERIMTYTAYIFFYSTVARLEGLHLIMARHMGIMNLSYPGRLYAYVCVPECVKMQERAWKVEFGSVPHIRRVLLVFILKFKVQYINIFTFQNEKDGNFTQRLIETILHFVI